MHSKYIYRMDDVTPDMDWEQFWKFINMFRDKGVIPLLGVVPDNRDPDLSAGEMNLEFWNIVKGLSDEGIVNIAQHGYQHRIEAVQKNSFRGKTLFSEFKGLSYEEQYKKIKAGKEIMNAKGLYTDIWMAPRHSFDNITLKALSDLDFKTVTDGIGLYPWKADTLTFIPQQLWKPRYFFFGVFTICLHVNNANDELYQSIKRHIDSGVHIISFREANSMVKGKLFHLLNRLFAIVYMFFMTCKSISRRNEVTG